MALMQIKEPPKAFPSLCSWHNLIKQFAPLVRARWPKSFYKDKSKCLKCFAPLQSATKSNLCPECYKKSECAARLVDPNEPLLDFYSHADEIEENLWLGSLYSAKAKLPLLEQGIRRILIVADCEDQFFPETFAYMQVKIGDDYQADLLSHLDSMLAFIEYGMQNGEGVLVHCAAGISRSASVVTAYIMKKHRWGLNASLEFVRTKREYVCPNWSFMKQLRKFEKKLVQ